MKTVLEHLEIEETPIHCLAQLHEVDALVLARLAYLRFELLLGGADAAAAAVPRDSALVPSTYPCDPDSATSGDPGSAVPGDQVSAISSGPDSTAPAATVSDPDPTAPAATWPGPITVAEACARLASLPSPADNVLIEDDLRLIDLLRDHPRYGSFLIHLFTSTLDPVTEKQFSAFICEVLPHVWAVIFRGTDNTLVGWKEDFNMSFTSPIPAQTEAVRFLTQACQRLIPADATLVLAGHSKGGNLAIYAGAFCPSNLRHRIYAVYNFDGPGFPREIIKTEGYQALSSRILTFLPQSSIIGMLMDQGGSYTIVRSKELSIMQHDIYNWEVLNRHLVPLKSFTNSSRLIDETLTDFLTKMPPEKRADFVEALFKIFRETKVERFSEMSENPIESIRIMVKALGSMDPSSRGIIGQGLDTLYQAALSNLRERFELTRKVEEREATADVDLTIEKPIEQQSPGVEGAGEEGPPVG